MVPALARVDLQRVVDDAARAEIDGRPVRRDARPVGGDQHVGGQPLPVGLCEGAQPLRPDFLAGLDKELRVEAEPPALRQHGLQRGERDAVLALVVHGAAPVELVAVPVERPGVAALPPLPLMAEHRVAVSVNEHGRQRLVLLPHPCQQGPAAFLRVRLDPDLEAHAIGGRRDLLFQIAP